jgi:hypothetical protein
LTESFPCTDLGHRCPATTGKTDAGGPVDWMRAS